VSRIYIKRRSDCEELLMGASLEVERLDETAASSLAERLTNDSQARVELGEGESCCVHIETEDASLGQILHMLEEWTTLLGKQSLRVRMNGQTYILECRKKGDTPQEGVNLPRSI
jgi:hypothetical protein